MVGNRYYVLGVLKTQDGTIKSVKVLNESLLEFQLANMTCIGHNMVAPIGMIKSFPVNIFNNLITEEKATITNANFINGKLVMLDGFKVTEVIKSGVRINSITGENFLQAIYKTKVYLSFNTCRNVLVCCSSNGTIKMIDYTDNKPPELLCSDMVNCVAILRKTNNSGNIVLRRNIGELRESAMHLSGMLSVYKCYKGTIYISKTGKYHLLDTTKLSLSDGFDSIQLNWLLDSKCLIHHKAKIIPLYSGMLDMYNKVQVEEMRKSPPLVLNSKKYQLAKNLNATRLGVDTYAQGKYSDGNKVLFPTSLKLVTNNNISKGKGNQIILKDKVGYLDIDKLLDLNTKSDITNYIDRDYYNPSNVNARYLDAFVVPPVFDSGSISTDYNCDVPDSLDIMYSKSGILLSLNIPVDSDLYIIYGLTNLSTVYFPNRNTLLPLKYYGIRSRKSVDGKVIINGFYKDINSKSLRMSNYMDIICGETGKIIKSCEITESNVTALIDSYIENGTKYSKPMSKQEIRSLKRYKDILVRMCKIDK